MLYPEKYNELTDLELIEEYKKNADKAFVGILYKRYSKLVFGLCMKYLKDEEEAQDLTVTVFVKLFDDLLKHSITYFKSWLYIYSKNQCLMVLRKKQGDNKRKQDFEYEQKQNMEMEGEMHLNANQREKKYASLEKAINELGEEQRICILLFFNENKSYQEIALQTGYTLNNVKSYIQNGKRNLKIKLENSDEETE